MNIYIYIYIYTNTFGYIVHSTRVREVIKRNIMNVNCARNIILALKRQPWGGGGGEALPAV